METVYFTARFFTSYTMAIGRPVLYRGMANERCKVGYEVMGCTLCS